MTTPAPRDRRRLLTRMSWLVLGLVPVLWVVELTGPDWLNMALRGLWVVLAVGTAAGGLWLVMGRRRGTGAGGPRR